ncbi:MAG: hypothetical protein ACNA7K_00660 [Acholeplasmataceae bacterium]
MKKFLVTYIIFSVIILILVYLVTFIQETQKRSNALFFEILNEGIETNNLDQYVKFQSIAYHASDIIETTDYSVHIYRVIEQENDLYNVTFNVFVIPITDVKFATKINDANDQSAIEILKTDDQTPLYRTVDDDDYENIAVSYGIEVLGIYFYKINLDQSLSIDLILYDYDGDLILNEALNYTHVTYDGQSYPDGFVPGYTIEEIIAMQNLTNYLVGPMMINIGLYLLIDISMGFLFYWFLKKKQL